MGSDGCPANGGAFYRCCKKCQWEIDFTPTLTEGEQLEKMRSFLMSEKPFRENTDNPLIPKEGIAHRQPDLQSAIHKLQSELDFFFEAFQKNPSLKTGNAFFGALDYEMNIQLLHKHAMHHLRQFGLV